MGYHVGGLVVHFFGPRKNDFVEMGLHHIVTLNLYAGMYLFNIWETGCPIALLHDIADILVNFTKLFSETKYSTIGGVLGGAALMPIWFYTRCLVLPFMIYKLWYFDVESMGSPYPMKFLCIMLGLLFLLHCYWFTIFIRILMKFITKGKVEDLQNKV